MKSSNPIATLVALIALSSSSVMAAESFDIDLKELKPARSAKPAAKQQSLEIDLDELKTVKPKKAKPKNIKRKQEAKSSPVAAETDHAKTGISVYTVRPGDHLALILVRHYGLTEVEARRLMPEVMRINSISSPQKVAVGQRLTIPLALPAAQQVTSEIIEPPSTPEQPQKAEPLKPVATPAAAAVLNADITYSDACTLARQMAEKLGLLMPSPSLELGGGAFSARYEDVAVTVVCNPPPAEAITYQRLLGMKGEQLLAIPGNSSAGDVVELLAERLGLTYRMAGTGRRDTLPLKYVFMNTAPDRPETQLTISAAVR